LFEYDVIGAIFGGQGSAISRILYGIVGLSALYCLTILFKPSEEFGKVPEHE